MFYCVLLHRGNIGFPGMRRTVKVLGYGVCECVNIFPVTVASVTESESVSCLSILSIRELQGCQDSLACLDCRYVWTYF